MRTIIQLLTQLCLLTTVTVNAAEKTVIVSNAWISEAPPTVNINAGYLIIDNPLAQPITLSRVESEDFERIEIHRSMLSEGSAKMELQTQIEIPGHSTFEFSPGDYHLMLFEPLRKLRSGMLSSFILHFSGEKQIEVVAEVKRLKLDNSHHH